MTTVTGEIREILPTWAIAVLIPLPAATFWQDGSGRAFAYAYLFLGCAIMTAERFRRPLPGNADLAAGGAASAWRAKMTALGLAMAGAVAVLTTFAWSMSGQPEAVVPLLATLAALPALCCVPVLTISIGKPYAAVLFTTFLLGAVKIAGCVVVRIVYGPEALAEGRMDLPFERPNLLVWLCFAGAGILSAVMFPLGMRAFNRCQALAADANVTVTISGS